MLTHEGVPEDYENIVQTDFVDLDSDIIHPAASLIRPESAAIADGEIIIALKALSKQLQQAF